MRRAFTLIELLVVVAIIALLLALLLPSLAKAKRQAREVVCRSNLRQVGIGVLSYAGEYGGTLPGSDEDAIEDPGEPHGFKTFSWLGTHPARDPWGHGGSDPNQVPQRGTVYRYVTGSIDAYAPVNPTANVFKCPEDNLDPRVSDGPDARKKVLYSYTAPHMLTGAPLALLKSTLYPLGFGTGNPAHGWSTYSKYARSTMPWMITEEDAVWALNYNTSAGWSNEDSITDRHSGRGAVCYIDGHVDTRSYQRRPRRMIAKDVFYELHDRRMVSAREYPVHMGDIRVPNRLPEYFRERLNVTP